MSELADYALWKRIQSYELNKSDIELPFSARLARETGWSPEFTARVCEEYKRFTYLMCISREIVTPSEEVDEAWHLHLVYTLEYWQAFCRDTLGRDIHHTPTDGGSDEAAKFRAAYERTLQLYQQEFGVEPPADIWPPVEARFLRQGRIAPKTHYILRKEAVHLAGLAGVTAVGSVAALLAGHDPLSVVIASVVVFSIGGAMVAPSMTRKSKGGDGGSGCGSGCGGCGG